jgi:mRNA interferase MazF
MVRGEVWWVDMEPTIGAEIGKVRLAVVINPPIIGTLPLRVIAPLTGWQTHLTAPWLVRIDPTPTNGLRKPSVVDCFQVRSLSTARFQSRVGVLSVDDLDRVTHALVRVIGAGP